MGPQPQQGEVRPPWALLLQTPLLSKAPFLPESGSEGQYQLLAPSWKLLQEEELGV